jgi:hypothetical protein
MDLPRALMPWASLLSLFPNDLIDALAPLVQRLDLAVGPMRANSRAGRGEPDGFQGLSRRGNPERLLLSEWLLAEEMPDEFLRRAAMGEQAFLLLAQTAPAGGRRSVVLFDAGPGQIGSPRLAHLVALLVLARRAETAGAGFAWGIAQKPDIPLLSVVSAATIGELLSARTSKSVTAHDLEQWHKMVSGTCDVDDFWLVGDMPTGGPSMAVLRVEDVFDPAVRQVRVTVCRPTGSSGGAVLLDLPPDDVCTRLLRDPFDSPPPVLPRRTATRFAPASNLLFTPGGTKLLARSADGGLLTYPVPNSPHGGMGKPKLYRCPAVDPIFAAGRVRKTYLIVTGVEKSGRVRVDGIGPKADKAPQGFYDISSGQSFPVRGPKSVLHPCLPFSATRGDDPDLYTLDSEGTLVRLVCEKGQQETNQTEVSQVYRRNVCAMGITAMGRHLVTVNRQSERWLVTSRQSDGDRKERTLPHDGDAAKFAFIGYGSDFQEDKFGLVALQTNFLQWTILSSQGGQSLTVPLNTDVVGVLGSGSKPGPGLLTLGPDRRRLTWLGLSWSHALPPASGHIASVAVSMDAPNVAYSTETGEVVVYSLPQNVVLYRLTPEETA